MKQKIPTSRFRRAFDIARVGAQAGASWATARGTEAAAKKSVEVLGNLRGLAAKIGQTASYVDGLIPPEQREIYEKALSQLQNATPTTPYPEVARMLEAELGAKPSAIFESLDEEPIASASIGQVHRANLKDGTPVAVKVQHAGIEQAVESDLRNVSMLEGVINLAGPKGLQAGAIFEEVLLRFRQELDYRVEARNQMAFRALHKDDPSIFIPEVFTEYSSRRVITSAYIDGFSLDQAAKQPENVRARYAAALWRFVFRGNLVGGAFNADPHPGNYIFHSDGRVHFLDFGCVQPISEVIRRPAVRAHQACLGNNMPAFDEAVAEMLGTRGGVFGDATRDYTRRCFAPLLTAPYRLTSAYAGELFQQVQTMKKAMSAKDKSFVAPPPQLALMNRLQFGFYSVIAKLDVEVDYRSVEATFLNEAAGLKQGRLQLS